MSKKVKLIKIEETREYQEADIFRREFQDSETCKDFRARWKIPQNGLENSDQFEEWEKGWMKYYDRFEKTEKFKTQYKRLKRVRVQFGLEPPHVSDLEWAELQFSLLHPLNKFDFDLDRLTLRTLRKPLYWRPFIRDCVLFHTVESEMISRPVPKPRLSWDNRLQRNVITIEDIFPDTTVSDFNSTDFTEKLRELQKKLPGYGILPRVKKNFKIEQVLPDLDSQGALSDALKADEVYGPIEDISRDQDRKRAQRIRQIRHRTRKRSLR